MSTAKAETSRYAECELFKPWLMSESLKNVCLVVIAMNSSVSSIALIPISFESLALLKCVEKSNACRGRLTEF